MMSVEPGTRWRHEKTGNVYVVLFEAMLEDTLTPAVVYEREGVPDVRRWVRPVAEFTDGRFVPLGDPGPGIPQLTFDGSTWDGVSPRGGRVIDRVPNSGDQ